MKNKLFPAILFIVLGLLIALVPVCLFPTCAKTIETAAGGAVPMKCFWSGRAEIGVGLLILCGGILTLLFRAPAARAGVSAMVGLAGVLALLIPSVLIRGCEMTMMPCRMTTFPSFYLLGGLTVAVSAIHLFYVFKKAKKDRVRTDEQ